MNNKLNTKDLINVGIFTALYLVAMIIVSGIVVVPILQILMLPIMALICGPIYLLYIAKVGKPFSVLITGFIGSLFVGLLVYSNVQCFLINMFFVILAEIIVNIGKYKNMKLNYLSYIVMSFWPIGEAGLPWIATKYFHELSVISGYSEEWASGVDALATPLNLVLMIIATIICAIISIQFSNKMFKKHFRKAGLIK